MAKIKIDPEGKGRRPTPSAFELSVIAALLAKGKEMPKDKLEAAWDLFNEADSLFQWQEEVFVDDLSDMQSKEAEWKLEQKIDNHILFLPKEGWDPARQYLLDKKKPLKTSKSVKKNLKPFFIRLRPKEWSEEAAERHFNKVMKQKKVYLPPHYLEEYVKDREANNRKSGIKAQETIRSKLGKK